MASILCLSIAGIIVSTWPHAQFTLSSEPSGTPSRSRLEGAWTVDAPRQKLRRGGASVERLTLPRTGIDARAWTLCSDKTCTRLETLLEASLAQSGLLDRQPVELSACALTGR